MLRFTTGSSHLHAADRSGSKLKDIRSDSDIEIVEMDEIHSYTGQKKRLLDILLLTDMTKDSSISLLVTGHHKQVGD